MLIDEFAPSLISELILWLGKGRKGSMGKVIEKGKGVLASGNTVISGVKGKRWNVTIKYRI